MTSGRTTQRPPNRSDPVRNAIAEREVWLSVEYNNLIAPPGITLPALVIETNGKDGLRNVVSDRDARAALVEGLDDLRSLRTSTTCLVSTPAPASTSICVCVSPCCPSTAHFPGLAVTDVDAGDPIVGTSGLIAGCWLGLWAGNSTAVGCVRGRRRREGGPAVPNNHRRDHSVRHTGSFEAGNSVGGQQVPAGLLIDHSYDHIIANPGFDELQNGVVVENFLGTQTDKMTARNKRIFMEGPLIVGVGFWD